MPEAYQSFWCQLTEVQKSLSYIGTKTQVMELRMDRMTASVGDALRHLVHRLTEWDPAVGGTSVLRTWISQERDFWLLRRSTQSWLLLSGSATQRVLNELCYLRLVNEHSEEDELRILATLRLLPGLLGPEKWLSQALTYSSFMCCSLVASLSTGLAF